MPYSELCSSPEPLGKGEGETGGVRGKGRREEEWVEGRGEWKEGGEDVGSVSEWKEGGGEDKINHKSSEKS